MKAEEARKIAEEARTSAQGVAASAFITVVVPKIREAAENGDNNLTLQSKDIGEYKRVQLVMNYGKTLGYKIEEHDDQRDGNYWTINW